MMGQQTGLQERLFYEFRLDDWVPVDHLLRKIDAVLDLSGLRRELAPFYSHTGRPSIDPELMIRMLLVGYCYGIRSERRLCQEVHLNLAYRWFCRLGLEGGVPEHSSFSKNRHGRFRERALFRRLFEDVVIRCVKAGLVGGEGFAIDASVIEADASRGRKVDGKPATWPEPEKITRPVREYLAALDQAAAEAAESESADGDMPPGNPPAAPKVTSLTDPLAAWTNKGQVKVGFAYGTNYLIDTRRAIILDVEPTPARWTAEVAATKTMLERTQECFGLKPQRLAADAAYGSGLMIGWLMRRGIEPHIPLLDREHQTNGFLPAPTSPLIRRPMSLPVPAASSSQAPDWSAPTAPCPIGRARKIAAPAPSSRAAPKEQSGSLRAISSRPSASTCAHCEGLKPSSAQPENGARSRWCLPISSGISVSDGCGCAG
jgi:transposase